MSTFKISEGLDQDDYPAVAKKVADLIARTNLTSAHLARWCDAKDECACRGCANRHLTWAEYECYRKYNPEFNKTSEASMIHTPPTDPNTVQLSSAELESHMKFVGMTGAKMHLS